jgi:hypothetical protein
MSAIGQAQTNAQILRDAVAAAAMPAGSRVLIAGAGTGQCFEFVPAEFLSPYDVTFSDISPRLLDSLSARLASSTLRNWRTAVDDLENSQLSPPFDFAAAILVLEHIDVRKGLETLARLAARVLIVVQQNPPSTATAVSPHRTLPGSMTLMREFHPALVDPEAVVDELGGRGLRLVWSAPHPVADGKTMLSLFFAR